MKRLLSTWTTYVVIPPIAVIAVVAVGLWHYRSDLHVSLMLKEYRQGKESTLANYLQKVDPQTVGALEASSIAFYDSGPGYIGLNRHHIVRDYGQPTVSYLNDDTTAFYGAEVMYLYENNRSPGGQESLSFYFHDDHVVKIDSHFPTAQAH